MSSPLTLNTGPLIRENYLDNACLVCSIFAAVISNVASVFTDPSPFISQKRGRVEEFAEGPIHTHVPVHGIRKRRLSQCVSLSPSKRQRLLSTSSEAHSGTNPAPPFVPAPPFDGCRDLFLPQGRPSGPDEFTQPTLQVPLDSNIPLDLGVFDWNWIPDPLVGPALSICT
jgi:hypothetical protein